MVRAKCVVHEAQITGVCPEAERSQCWTDGLGSSGGGSFISLVCRELAVGGAFRGVRLQ